MGARAPGAQAAGVALQRLWEKYLRQHHRRACRLFVDYASQIRRPQIFVGLLADSDNTFACAIATQAAADWVNALIRCMEFVGGDRD